MNIFYVDSDSKLAAQALCDKHVVKMILESAQLLCTAHHLHTLWSLPEKFYKPTHKNHPCSIWVRKQSANYAWLATHAAFLCKEYTYRYGKTHASLPVIDWCLDNFPDICIGFGTNPPQCMPDEYKCEDTVEAYRRYYNECKRNTIQMKWTRRNPPEWWNVC
jgi:hypothetical protein